MKRRRGRRLLPELCCGCRWHKEPYRPRAELPDILHSNPPDHGGQEAGQRQQSLACITWWLSVYIPLANTFPSKLCAKNSVGVGIIS